MTPARQQQEANTCIHSQVCRYRFINDAPCSSLVCQYFATHTSPPAPVPICDRCKTDQEPFCIGCERLKKHDAQVVKDACEQMSTKKWIVVYEMDDYEPAIHEYDNEKEAREDWDDNKTDRTGHKCIALVMEDEESLRARPAGGK